MWKTQKRAPTTHTVLEIVQARWGTGARLVSFTPHLLSATEAVSALCSQALVLAQLQLTSCCLFQKLCLHSVHMACLRYMYMCTHVQMYTCIVNALAERSQHV